jgi:hypothetical protein
MMSLYQSGYRPFGLPKKYEATSIAIKGDGQAAEVMLRKGGPDRLGDPIDAVAFFDEASGGLVALVCDYANGRRAEWRRTRSGERLQVVTPDRVQS